MHRLTLVMAISLIVPRLTLGESSLAGRDYTYLGSWAWPVDQLVLGFKDEILVCGSIGSEDVDLDPTKGVDIIESMGGYGDAFLTKLGADGSYQWSRVIASANFETATVVGAGADGSIYLGGAFIGVLDFDPSDGVDFHFSQGFLDIFVTKFTADGDYVKTVTFGSPPYGSLSLDALTVSTDGDFYITGEFYGTTDFDPSEGTDNHTPVGGADIYVSRLTPDLEQVWTLTFGGDEGDHPYALDVGGQGELYVAGIVQGDAGAIDFDPTKGEDWVEQALNHPTGFVMRLEQDGTYGWTQTLLGLADPDYVEDIYLYFPGKSEIYGVKFDGQGNVYATGKFNGNVDFDPTEGEDIRESVDGWWCNCHSDDAFLWKLGTDGSYRWTQVIGNDSGDEGYEIEHTSGGDVIWAGEFKCLVDFDPGPEEENYYSYGNTFLTQYDSKQNYDSTLVWGGVPFVNGHFDGLGVTSNGSLIVLGSYGGGYVVDFDPTEGEDWHDTAVDGFEFLVKLSCVDEPPPCDGDVNADSIVDPLDSGYVLARFDCPIGQGDPLCDAADVNVDGWVDPLDVGFVMSRFGSCD